MLQKLKDRLNVLSAQEQSMQSILMQTSANINAINGAMQEVNYWIKQLEENLKEGEKIDS